MGTQPSIMVAMKGGLIAKVNRPGAERVMHSQPLAKPTPLAEKAETDEALSALRAANAAKEKAAKAAAAAAEKEAAAAAASAPPPKGKKGRQPSSKSLFGGSSDPAKPEGTKGPSVSASIDSSVITREYFTGHTDPVIMLGFVDNNSYMLSLDASGLMLEWPYQMEHYSSYGWFRPSQSTRISTALRMACRDPEKDVQIFPKEGLSPYASAAKAPEPKGRGRRGRSSSPPPVEPSNAPQEYSAAFLRASAQNEVKLRRLKLPELPWRTRRMDNGHVVRLYYEPKSDVHESEVVSVTRDENGVLFRHGTCQYVHKRVHGKLLNACLNQTASELAVLMRFDDVPEGPQLRLQTMPLAPGMRKWHPLKMIVPTTTRLPTQLAIGPHMDVPASEYAFVLADNVVRIFSMGSGCQVRLIKPVGDDISTTVLDSLSVASSGKFLAVGCSGPAPDAQKSGFWVHDLTPPQRPDEKRGALVKARAGSARFGTAFSEQRVRENSFYLGVDRAGALNDHRNVSQFMGETALQIVEDALRATDPPPEPVAIDEDDEADAESRAADPASDIS